MENNKKYYTTIKKPNLLAETIIKTISNELLDLKTQGKISEVEACYILNWVQLNFNKDISVDRAIDLIELLMDKYPVIADVLLQLDLKKLCSSS